jgi:hypothetical protein
LRIDWFRLTEEKSSFSLLGSSWDEVSSLIVGVDGPDDPVEELGSTAYLALGRRIRGSVSIVGGCYLLLCRLCAVLSRLEECRAACPEVERMRTAASANTFGFGTVSCGFPNRLFSQYVVAQGALANVLVLCKVWLLGTRELGKTEEASRVREIFRRKCCRPTDTNQTKHKKVDMDEA